MIDLVIEIASFFLALFFADAGNVDSCSIVTRC